MFNLILLGTSWCPVVLIVGLHEALCCGCWEWFYLSLGVSICLILACKCILEYKTKNGKKQTLKIESIESRDSEVLIFVFATLLPIMRERNESIIGHPVTMICIFIVITVTLYTSRSYHINPVIRIILRYHCYSAKYSNGTSILLISKKDLITPGMIEQTVRLTKFVRLQVSD